MKKIILLSLIVIVLMVSCIFYFKVVEKDYKSLKEEKINMYSFKSEESKHEGTWLIWPHEYTYGKEYKNEIEHIWVKMTKELHLVENVHIITYNEEEKVNIIKTLKQNKVNMDKIDFVISKSDDVWTRDTGPIFVYNDNNELVIADFKFDGWGKKAKYRKDNNIPINVAKEKNISRIDISDFVLEGGSFEIDGKGTLMGTLSSILSKNRNKGLTLEKVEEYLSIYLGVENFIWLDGVVDEDITDAHIDGMARFIDNKRILTVSKEDFRNLYEDINMEDYYILKNALNIDGEKYEIIEMPLTKTNPPGVDYKGSYLNYYIANEVILFPIYNDEMDKVAIDIISKVYEDRKIIPININDLYKYGGMIHCVTQQQPSI